MATSDSMHADGRDTDEHEPTRPGVVWTARASMAAILGAVALAVLPRVVPSQAALIGKLAKNGLTWPLLFCVGLVLAAIAATALKRTPKLHVEPRHEPEPEPRAVTPDPLTKEIAAELGRVRGGLHDMRVEFVYVKDALARLQQNAAHVDESASGESEAAIFRLAASLDQLGGRVEHELHAQRAWIAAALEYRSTAAMSNSVAESDPYANTVDGPVHEIDLEPGYVAAEGDMHVEVTLEDEKSWSGLGVLDQLDDLPGPLSHAKKSPSANPGRTMGLLDEVEHGLAKSAAVESKMTQLRVLLSDPEVQKAIDRSQY